MRTILSFLLFFFFFYSNAQDEIFLENPSFEDYPKLSHTPAGWYDCGFARESQVDIHPVPASEFQVDKTAIDGETYLGMVTRENGTWESIGQKLPQALTGGKNYSFNIHLARSATYLSTISSISTYYIPDNKTNFATPITLRIWGGNSYCEKVELLAQSSLIINTRWLDFNFALSPKEDLSYITFEAFYQVSSSSPYNGNLLLDNASSVLEMENSDFSKEDSIHLVYLDSLENDYLLTDAQGEITLREKQRTKSMAAPKSISKVKHKRYKVGLLNEEDRTSLSEQLNLIKFIPGSQYLEDKSMDSLLDIVRTINASKRDLKVVFYINTAEKKWNKKRGREVLSLIVNAGVPLMNIKISKSFPAKKNAYFRGGYSDIYLCVY